ncbi:MAG: hypothetical protein ACI9XO_002087 [Paraglaciecola sp.]|jgi:hypothetical protein
MKNYAFTLFVFCLALLTAYSSFLQKAPHKFGKVDIEELPESISLALSEKGGRFFYSISAIVKTINLTTQLKIQKYLFYPKNI